MPPYGQPPQKQKVPAWVWWVIGGVLFLGCCVPGVLILAAILFPVFAQARLAARSTQALSTAKNVDLSLIQYTSDHDGKLPQFTNPIQIAQDLAPYDHSEAERTAIGSYAWNPALSGANETTLIQPNNTWVFYGQDPRRGSFDVAFADGHVKVVTFERLQEIKSQTANTPPVGTGDGAPPPVP
jgi:prepilin-type processing-associated H-X9-DG protein